MSFTIIQDTREQQPWDFGIHMECTGSVRQGLSEGDYTSKEILDLEISTGRKILRIERKMSTGEMSLTLGKNYQRFLDEMDRLSDYEHHYIVLEFSKNDLFIFPKNSGIPQHLWTRKGSRGKTVSNLKMNGKIMYARLMAIYEKYGTKIIYAGDRQTAMYQAVEIIEKVHRVNNLG